MNFWTEFAKAMKYRKLTAAELWPLIYRVRAGDEKALEEIIKRNSPLIYYKVADWLYNAEKYGIDPMDLVRSGCIGLSLGTLSFNPSKGKDYLTYVS